MFDVPMVILEAILGLLAAPSGSHLGSFWNLEGQGHERKRQDGEDVDKFCKLGTAPMREHYFPGSDGHLGPTLSPLGPISGPLEALLVNLKVIWSHLEASLVPSRAICGHLRAILGRV